MTFLMMLTVILLSMLMILLSTFEQASNLWQQLELLDTVDWGRMRLANFNAGKTQLASFDQFNNIF